MGSRIIYGPILSRRLGRSLGIDIIKKSEFRKNCNFDCVYCQLGHVDWKISTPSDVTDLVTTEEVIDSLANYHKKVDDLDYITFSGTCEPTLNLELGNMIEQIRNISDVPICVITNSSLVNREDVRNSLSKADLVVATLVSGNEETFQSINRPAEGIELQDIIKGLRELQKMKGSRVAIEVMLLDSNNGYLTNSSDQEIEKLIEVLKFIDPDEIEILTISRPSAEEFIIPVTETRLKEIAQKFDEKLGRERVRLVLKGLKRKRSNIEHENPTDEVYDLILRRPCTFDQVVRSLDIDKEELSPIIEGLVEEHKIIGISSENGMYYRAV
ncbi:radical SAM protein [Methanococcoides alaskense]|uniref:Wyosine [tRNA(Phe)-imidazoG37] synthetase (Radical SAM superfamily) n=1 Tax=Methanococcoides alaskense TaxID=325778 RepID=A0AA90TX42_9EURY|nr:radical SAM protein [Methanococcoides alaskense]MDA0525397.1 radical SAM protein [Methanococcoides alaskense]MDR6221670.1 wyosine [tRNA(Phe)-imidazoG37] synthetase (radical SAM superfamily) [Methanococcoides alaskense]